MKKSILLFLVFILTTTVLFPQQVIVKNKKPFITIETSGSLNLPIMDLKSSNGDIRGLWAFEDYGTTIGFGGTANIKFAVYNSKRLQLRTYVMLEYSHFVNDDATAYLVHNSTGTVTYGYPYMNQNGVYPQVRDTTGVSNIRMNIPSLALGCELGIYTDTRNRSSINIGLDYNFNVIFGRVYQTIGAGNAGEVFNTYRANLRNGLGLNLSYSYKFTNILGFHVGTRFAWQNLFGKSSEMTDGDTYMYLLDRANSTLNPALTSSRNIAQIKFYTGLSLFLGNL